ncbi:hypothetical protein B0H14DRAFT_2712180, partial [Mycena olivaceomarginata]
MWLRPVHRHRGHFYFLVIISELLPVDSVVSRRPPSPLQRLNGVGGQGAADEMEDGRRAEAGPGTQEGKGYLFIQVPLHARRSQAGTRREMSLFGVAAFLPGP